MIGEYLFWIATTHLDDTDRIVETLRVVYEEIDLDLGLHLCEEILDDAIDGSWFALYLHEIADVVRALETTPTRSRRTPARRPRPSVPGRRKPLAARRPQRDVIARSNASRPTNAPDVHAIVTTAYLVSLRHVLAAHLAPLNARAP